MSDIRLFRTKGKKVVELEGRSVAVEKSLQAQIEEHMEEFLGVRFLASEYSTGKSHGGRIDSLGLDENGCPVIVEYKRTLNENVINQGLFYLDWLLDHKAEFKLLVMDMLSKEASDAIEWTAPRLLCIAGGFTKYDGHAVQQINRNIELIRYKRFGDELLLLDLVNATSAQPESSVGSSAGVYKTVTELLGQAPGALKDLYHSVEDFLLGLGDEVQKKTLKNYFAFKRIKNFACVEVKPQGKKLVIYAKLDPDTVEIRKGFTRDVRKIGHFGTGDLEITIKTGVDFEAAKSLLVQSFENS